MKAKKLLLISALFMFTALSAIAQNTADVPPSLREHIPFGKKFPTPDVKNRSSLNVKDIFRAGGDAIRKDPEFYRKQLLASRKLPQMPLMQNTLDEVKEESETCTGADAYLAKDINALAESNPANAEEFTSSFAVLDNVAYFAADDGIHGTELWRSDGTAGGTYLVKDIVPGAESAFPYYITAANGKLYFTAITAEYGLEPWISDGTENGTQLLKDLNPGPAHGYTKDFIAVGSEVYFVADGSNIYWDAIWKTDGTKEGTVLVKDIGGAGGGIFILEPTVANGLLFFTMFDFTYGFELWRSDGTEDGTYLLKDIGPLDYSSLPTQLTSYDNKLYFSADDGTGRKLWLTDGTSKGTKRASNSHHVLVDADNFYIKFPVINDVLYLPGYTLSKGSGLYKYDASNEDGIVLVKTITPNRDTDYIVPTEMKVVNNTLYFKVFSTLGGYHDELWSSNGSTAELKTKFPPGQTIYGLYNGSGILYFINHNSILGTELWRGIDFAFGSIPVSDIFHGTTSSYPAYLTSFKGKLLFTAADGKKGNELYVSNGTFFDTKLVKDINTTATSDSQPLYLSAFGNEVLFNAKERVHGTEPYKSNGTAAGTVLVKDIVPGEAGSNPYLFASKNNTGYFISQENISYSIYKTDGTKSGTHKITPDFSAYQYFIISIRIADDGLVFYTVFNFSTFLYELWRTDGTAAGNYLLSTSLYSSNYLNVVGNTAFFVAGDATYGYELWKSDGSVAGTLLVKDINPGVSDALPGGIIAYHNEVYFGAYDGTNHAFWKSDGTKEGTIQLKNIDPWWGTTPDVNARFFCISNDVLYFSAVRYATPKGTQLWKTDGTAAGTIKVKDINLLDGTLTPGSYNLTDVNGTLYFTADDGVHGYELWKSDGTREGTQIVKDITRGISPTDFGGFASLAGKMFFTKYANGFYHLWSSDGTATGTKKVLDPDIKDVAVGELISAGDKLFFSGYNYKYGWELYSATACGGVAKFAVASNQSAAKTINAFNASLYPNPATSIAALQITGNTKNVSISITDIKGKKLWQISNSSTTSLNLPMQKLASGIYIVTVTNGTETKTLKLVKQ